MKLPQASSQVKYTFVLRFRTFQDFEFVQGSTLCNETHISASYFTFQVGIADACTGLKWNPNPCSLSLLQYDTPLAIGYSVLQYIFLPQATRSSYKSLLHVHAQCLQRRMKYRKYWSCATISLIRLYFPHLLSKSGYTLDTVSDWQRCINCTPLFDNNICTTLHNPLSALITHSNR